MEDSVPSLVPTIDNPSEYRRHQYPPVFVPHALCLTVFLSTASFLQSYDQKLKKTVYHDIKIDVYFNGELCGSSFIPERHRGKTYHMTEHIVRFSGRRIGRLLEKPWIIVPTGQNPDGSLSENRRILKGSYSGANARWEAISKTLGAEADRIGQDKHGEFPILADYLSTLAKLHMPREVEEMQKAGYPKYGLIDVVVITGKGQKDGASSPALTEPTSLRIKETKSSVQTNSGVTALKATSNLVVDFTANESTKTKGYEFLIPLNPEHHIEKSERLTCSPTIPTSQFHPSSLRRIASRAHPPSEQHAFETPGSAFCSLGNDPQKGSGDSFSFMPKPRLPMAMPYNFGFDSKRTLEEEIALLEAGAQQAANSENDESHVPNPIQRMTRSGLVNRDATSKQISAKLVGIGPERTKVIKLRMNFPTAEQTKRGLMQANPVTRPGPFNVSRGPTTLAAVPCSSPSTIPLLTEGFSEAFPTPDSRARMLPTMWTMPPLSEDSMLTYAPAGVVRPCKGERNGWFEEKRVLMGARFLVG